MQYSISADGSSPFAVGTVAIETPVEVAFFEFLAYQAREAMERGKKRVDNETVKQNVENSLKNKTEWLKAENEKKSY
jgi:ribosomal protein L21